MTQLKPILLVEDNAHDLDLALIAFKRCELQNEVVVARDGVDALDWICKQNQHADRKGLDPAVIILDLKLPRIDGLEVLKRIKSEPATRHIPVIMLTASNEESDLVSSYDLGVNGYVVKPVDFKKFFDSMKDIATFWGSLNKTHPGYSPHDASLDVTRI